MSAFDGTNGPTLKIQFYFGGSFQTVPVADLREVNLNRGRARADQKIDAGNMSVVFDNKSGDYDPDNLSGPWVSGGVTALRDGLRARFVATWSGTGYVLFDGYLETTEVDAGFDAFVTMTFVDAIAKFSKVTAKALKTSAYQETTATRVGRMLTYAAWPTGSSWRNISGSVVMQKTGQDQNITDMINECVLAEAGGFYVSRSGVATFVTNTEKFNRPTQLLFDDSRATNTVEYNSIKTTPGTLQVVNNAVVTRGKLKQKTFTYKPSVTKYGTKTVTVETTILSDNTAQKLATYLARKDANPSTTVSEINFTALALGALYPDFLSTELLDQVTVKRTTVDGRNLTIYLVVEGMQHKITPDDWNVTYQTSPMNSIRLVLP